MIKLINQLFWHDSQSMSKKMKKYCIIGCCGIDCGLCPRFHTQGSSACPGCGGPDFKSKHPSCGFLTCCATKNGYEVCSDCSTYPCQRFEPEKSGYDSFVTHRKVFPNLASIKSGGIEQFIRQQGLRREILTEFLTNFDDGRSKSFFCIGCTLLPLDCLQSVHKASRDCTGEDIKVNNQRLRALITAQAAEHGISLKLNKK